MKLGLALWATEPVGAMAAHAALAEAVGFDSVWVIDSQLLCRDVFVTLGAILSATKTLRAATGVTQPFTRHVSVAASAIASLAEMSDNRAILGVGTGFSSLGTIGRKAARIADVEAFVDAARRLVAGREADFDAGVSGRLAFGGPGLSVPIVVAATGPRMTKAGARFADGVIVHQGLSPDLLGRALGWVAEGAGDRRPEVSCWAPYSMATDPNEAHSRVRARVAGALANVRPDWFDGEERAAVERLQAAYHISDHASASPAHAALVPDSLIPRFAVAGSAEEVRAQLRALMAQPGVDRIILTPQVVGDGARPLGEVLRAFGDEVLARL